MTRMVSALRLRREQLSHWLQVGPHQRVLDFARKIELPEFSVQRAERLKSCPAARF